MHKEFLLSALQQAKLGRGRCAPNPSVGAVAVHNGVVIAKACHLGAGSPHAERVLLAQLPAGTQGVTLYVTLEPCNHWGRTPPCVEAIIAHDVKRVVYAYSDPNPLVSSNHTPKILQDHGIEVLHYPVPEINEFYQSYHHWLQTGMPWVTMKVAQSLDGKITGRSGERAAISNAACFDFTQQRRSESDVILTTSATVLRDNPQFTVRKFEQDVEAKPIAILDTHLQLRHDIQALALAKTGHVYYEQDQVVEHQQAGCTYYPIPLQGNRLNLTAVLGHLGALGYHDVWVEAGAQLFGEMHKKRLVNRTYIYIAAHVIGASALSLYSEDITFEHSQSSSWQVMDDNVILTMNW